MAGAALWAAPAQSQSVDATWLLDPTVVGPVAGTRSFNADANWIPSTVPTGPAGTAFFGVTNQPNISFSDNSSIGGWTFNAGASDYEFTSSQSVGFTGAGIFINGGSATITIAAGNVSFSGMSTAGSATFINNNILEFDGNSTAGSATLINAATLRFRSDGSAGNATITNNATLEFNNNSTGEQAQILTNAGGVTDFSDSSGPLVNNELTAGSLAGAGNYYLGFNQLTVGGNNLSTEVSGVISDCGTGSQCQNTAPLRGSLVKTGTGTFTLSGMNTYTGPTTVNGGTLAVNGSIVSDVTVNNGGELGGTGQIGALTVGNGGTVAPGNSIGTMTVGNFTLGAGAVYEVG